MGGKGTKGIQGIASARRGISRMDHFIVSEISRCLMTMMWTTCNVGVMWSALMGKEITI